MRYTYLFLLLYTLINYNGLSQNLHGSYCNKLGEYFIFKKNNIVEFRMLKSNMCYNEYVVKGEGSYQINRLFNNLKINTKYYLKDTLNHNVKKYKGDSCHSLIKFYFVNEDSVPIMGVHVLLNTKNDLLHTVSDSNGMTQLNIKHTVVDSFISIDLVGYNPGIVPYYGTGYYYKIFLSSGKTIHIENKKIKFNIEIINQKKIIIKDNDYVATLVKCW